jgi:hypothetical protein
VASRKITRGATSSKSRPNKKVTRKGKSKLTWAQRIAATTALNNPKQSKKYLPLEAYRSDGTMFAMARLRDPEKPGYYSNWPGRRWPFVVRGYRIWTLEEWLDDYGNGQPNQTTSPHWEFFGEKIELWEDTIN